MVELLQLLGDPERPLPVAACVADEDVRQVVALRLLDDTPCTRRLTDNSGRASAVSG
jgi:hypothetical protein